MRPRPLATRLLATLQANPDGTTIDPLTYQPRAFKNGYAVALTDNAFKHLTLQATTANARKLQAYARTLNLRTFYFGYWRDGKTGKNFFDLSLVIPRKAEAMSLARTFGQKAIFDFKTLTSVYLTA